MSYRDCLDTEARSKAILRPYLEFHSGSPLVALENCAAAKQLQRIGDVVMGHPRGCWTYELKAEEKWTKNLYLEAYSNLNIGSAGSRADHPTTLGWVFTCTADVTIYHFIDENFLCIYNTQAVLELVFGKKHNGLWHALDFPWRFQTKHAQPNDTLAPVVPILYLQQKLGPQFQCELLGDMFEGEFIRAQLQQRA